MEKSKTYYKTQLFEAKSLQVKTLCLTSHGSAALLTTAHCCRRLSLRFDISFSIGKGKWESLHTSLVAHQ